MSEKHFPNFQIDLLRGTSAEDPPRKKRFAVLDDNQLDKLLDGAHAISTKYKTNHSVSVYKGKFIAKILMYILLDINT